MQNCDLGLLVYFWSFIHCEMKHFISHLWLFLLFLPHYVSIGLGVKEIDILVQQWDTSVWVMKYETYFKFYRFLARIRKHLSPWHRHTPLLFRVRCPFSFDLQDKICLLRQQNRQDSLCDLLSIWLKSKIKF